MNFYLMLQDNGQFGSRRRNAAAILSLLFAVALSGCIDDMGEEKWIVTRHTIKTLAGKGGSLHPARLSLEHGRQTRFDILAKPGYRIDKVIGCGGVLSNGVYVTAPITADCNITAYFSLENHVVTTYTEGDGVIIPAEHHVPHGNTTVFSVQPAPGFEIEEITGCGGSLSPSGYTTAPITTPCQIAASFRPVQHVIHTNTGSGGSVHPQRQIATHGSIAHLTVTPDSGYEVEEISGCSGSLTGNVYTIEAVTGECTVMASFRPKHHVINAYSGIGGQITPVSTSVAHGKTATFILQPDDGYQINTITGCNGTVINGVFTTGPVNADCSIEATFIRNPPIVGAIPVLTPTPVKQFHFSWSDVANATYYRLLENPDGNTGFSPVSKNIPAGVGLFEHDVSLPLRPNARYILQSCNEGGCNDAPAISVDGTLTAAIGYFKASNTGARDQFGYSVSLSANGNTLAVGAPAEDGSSTGIDGGDNNSATNSGAVYLFVQADGSWVQQAYIKASNTGAGDRFGFAIALSDDGNRLAVGAPREDSGGGENDGSLIDSGAVYLFERVGDTWIQTAYLKADNPGAEDQFGYSVSLNGDGQTLAVGAPGEDSDSSGINSDGGSDNAGDSGAVYVFVYNENGWVRQAYIKAGNAGTGDRFGSAVSLSDDGNTLAVGSPEEDGNATGVNADTGSDSKSNSGAGYLFHRNGNDWIQQAYIKASNTGAGDRFGHALSLSGDGTTLAVGAWGENSAATGVNGAEKDNSAADSGAVYLYTSRPDGWQQVLYLKSGNSEAGDRFGWSVSLNGNGTLLAVGARLEDGGTIGINENPSDNTASGSGAAYLFVRENGWTQRSYIKANNTGSGDQFGRAIHLSDDGSTLVVSGYREDGGSIGVNGNANSESETNSGAVYLY